MRESWHRIGAIARHNTLIRLRDPGQMIAYIVMPMVLMAVLKPMYVRVVQTGTLQVVTGLLIMFSVFAIAVAGNSVLVERNWQTWDRLRASRATAAEILIGKTVPIFVVMTIQQALLFTFGALVIGLPIPAKELGWVALAILVWAAMLLAVGAALAAVARSSGELSMISDIGAMVLSSMGGALVPLAIMPGWARAAAHGSPGYWALRMMQSAVRGDAVGVLEPAAVVGGICLVAGVFGARRLARGWGRGRLL